MKNGARPTKVKHTDYDFLRSHRFGGVAIKTTFKDEYFADAGLTMPNQDGPDTEYVPTVPPLPYGCTDYTGADITSDLYKGKYHPMALENITHANALGGYDIRKSLDAARQNLGWITQYFNLRASGIFDSFDTFRVAQMTGLDAGENRSISWGTPWFPSWEAAIAHGETVMPMPTLEEINDVEDMPWHNSKLDGWTTIGGVLVYRNKSWQGNTIGDKGFIYFPREVVNMVMGISGTVAFTATKSELRNPQTVDLSTLQFILSFLRVLLAKYVPAMGRFL